MRAKIGLWIQLVILHVSYALHAFAGSKKKALAEQQWVVGVQEIASMLSRVQEAIPGSVSVCMYRHPFYSNTYDYQRPQARNATIDHIFRHLYGPWLLGKLARCSRGFIYLGTVGFLVDPVTQRAMEFRFLKKRFKKVVCYFTGDDIRSNVLSLKLAEKFGFPNLSSVRVGTVPELWTDEYDEFKREIARVADTHADAIFNWPVDQVSYIASPQQCFQYAYPDELFQAHFEKFTTLDPLVIVHAPSDQLLKGTLYVRAAIKKLRSEGRNFEYIELDGVGNAEVMATLARAHIVLNQFHAYVPGVLGIEALANSCVMMCSADETIEPFLPKGANKAWVVTRPDQVYSHLKKLLDSPQTLEKQARAGFEWAQKNVSRSSATKYLGSILSSI